ncbi:MAG: hypothetical protein Q7S43_01175, partial [bacterium]|nr:hypothetical protein [bacterium]
MTLGTIYLTIIIAMQHTFHCHLSKSFRWYKNWHTHPQHQHAHWSIFVIITFFISSFISGSINSTGQFYSEQNSALAQTGLTLGISGDRFTINGNPQFLLFISYFDAMNASDAILDSDFARLQSLGFNGIRIITNWNPPGNPGQLMDANGNLRPGMLNRLINIIQKAQNHGLIVDVTFTRDTVPGLSVPNYKNGLVATAQGLTAYRNLYFDIGNEADHDGTTCGSARLCPAEARQIRDAIKAVDSQRIISVSLSSDSGNEPSYVINGAMDFHPTHGPFSTFNGTRAFVSGEKAAVPGKPVHLQEPDRCRSNPCSYSANAFITSATDAKCSGAAGWNFHTRAGYDLTAYTLFNSWLDPNIENGVVNGLASSLANTSWNSCGSSVPPPPPPTGPPPPSPNGVSGQYQCSPSGRDVPGYIGLAGANASFVDPAILSPGWYCDEDSGIDGSVTGLNFPVQAILTCSASSGTAFVTDDVWNHCNDTPGWDFSTYPPTKNGQSVQFIATVNCPGTVTFTLAHGNITAGAWTQSPAVEGLVCARGTVISTQPPPPPPPPPDTPRQCAFGGGPQCSDWGSGSNTSQWCACEFLCTGTNVNPACLTPPPPPPPPPEPTAAESPIITSINPLTVYPGDTIEIIGEFLGTTVQFTDTTGQSSYATGIISDDQRIVTVTVPDGLPAGTYTVSIINPNDIATASDVLTILEIQNFIGPNAQSLEPPTTASTFQDLISNSFNYAIMFVGIAVFIMILWAGFLWVTSAANPGNIATAKGY